MKALIYDEVFPDLSPVEIENIRSVSYTQHGKTLYIYYQKEEAVHHYTVKMDDSQYKRRVVFE